MKKFLSFIVGLALLLCVSIGNTASLFPYPKFHGQTSTGAALSGGKLYTYAPGTTTPKASYTTAAMTTPNTNPVILNSNGDAVVYLNGLYDVVLKNSAGVTQWSMSSVNGINAYTSYEVDALNDYGSGTSFTQATIEAALTAIGTTDKVTLLIRPGTWVISSALSFATYKNVTLKIPAGAYFSLSGSGTVTGLQQEMTPQMFGAAGNGTTDDTSAINAALASSTRVLIPKTADSYLVTAALTPISNQVIIIEGEIKTAQPAAGAFNIFNIGTKTNVKIIGKGGKITGDGVTTGQIGIKSITSSNVTVESMEITATDYGMWLRTTSDMRVRDNYIHDVLSVGIANGYSVDAAYNYFSITGNRIDTVTGYGILSAAMDRGVIANNVISNVSHSGATSVGIMVYHGNRVAVTGNSLFFMGALVDAIVFYESGSNDSCTGNTLFGTTGAGGGIQVSGINGMSVSGNQINGTFLQPVVVDGNSPNVVIAGNSITGTNGHAINLTERTSASPSFGTITGNTITSIAGGAYAGINLDKDTAHINVSGNIINGSAYGIKTGTNTSYVNINNNEVLSYTVHGVLIGDASDHAYLRGNYIDTLAAGGTVSLTLADTSDYIYVYDDNRLVNGKSVTTSGTNVYYTRTATFDWDVSSLGDGVGETSGAITVTGAKIGNIVQVGCPYDVSTSALIDTGGLLITGYVSATNTVKIRVQNETGGVIDLARAYWPVTVRQF